MPATHAAIKRTRRLRLRHMNRSHNVFSPPTPAPSPPTCVSPRCATARVFLARPRNQREARTRGQERCRSPPAALVMVPETLPRLMPASSPSAEQLARSDAPSKRRAGAAQESQERAQEAAKDKDCGTAEESERERLKRHRMEMGGRVWIPEKWGQEGLLKDWIDSSVFDRSLVPSALLSAREALVVDQCRRTNAASRRIKNPC